jgi:hypothetical protein
MRKPLTISISIIAALAMSPTTANHDTRWARKSLSVRYSAPARLSPSVQSVGAAPHCGSLATALKAITGAFALPERKVGDNGLRPD